MSKFSGLAAKVSESYRVKIISPETDLPLKDDKGKEAYVDVLSADSDIGRKFDKEQRAAFQRRAMRGRSQQIIEDDGLEQNIAKLSRLTTGWYLVDLAGVPIDEPFSQDSAKELYSASGMEWLYRQVWLGANETANFMKSSSKIS